MRRTKADLVKAWLIKAEKDLFFAHEAAKLGAGYTDVACFHAQQAVEKTLKAYLVWLEIEFPKTHVLEDLLDLIAQEDHLLESWRESLRLMTPYAVEIRYPEFSIPSLDEARQAVETASEVLNLVKGVLPADCLPQ